MTWILRRLFFAVITATTVASLVFFLSRLAPGDPAALMLGDGAAAADVAALRTRLGLDLSLWNQYLSFLSNLGHFRFGESFIQQRPVLDLILERFPMTLLLASVSMTLSLTISIPFGVWLSLKRAWSGEALSTALLVVSGIPSFVMGPLLILLFSVSLGLFPISGYGSPMHVVLPMLCLSVGSTAYLVRLLRASMLEAFSEDYVRTALAKGLSLEQVAKKHVFQNALVPVITAAGNTLSGLLAGAVVTETVFDWPGLGRLFYSSFQTRDFPLIQGVVIWTALTSILVVTITDFVLHWVDPRARTLS